MREETLRHWFKHAPVFKGESDEGRRELVQDYVKMRTENKQ